MTDVHSPATSVRRRRLYLFRDLAEGRGEAVRSALSERDRAAEYRGVVSLAQFQPGWPSANALVCFVAQDVAYGRETLFVEVKAFQAVLGPVPTALLTDSDDPAFLKSCYAHGISQVLQTTLSVSVIVQSLELIANGRAFVPVQLLGQSDATRSRISCP